MSAMAGSRRWRCRRIRVGEFRLFDESADESAARIVTWESSSHETEWNRGWEIGLVYVLLMDTLAWMVHVYAEKPHYPYSANGGSRLTRF